MRIIPCAMFALLALGLTGGHAKAEPAGCRIEGPDHLVPEKVKRVRLGMSKGELENVLGEADYSPAAGLFYFSTGGDCPLGDTDRLVSCGVVAEFLDHDGSEAVLTESLQSCWWGGIAE